ncbi:MAG: beta-lactamase family protein [Bacteroidia bacterium]|nr:beta-lactamase family protein [Bacteroidia bacterium]
MTGQKEKIDLILSRLHDKGLFNGNVLVATNGKILLKKSYGVADFRDQTPLQLQSVFRIASVSKQFTAMAVMILRQEGKLLYDDPLRKFFPDFPYPSVQIRHLLSHTSGLPDYISQFYTHTPEMMTYASNQNVVDWIMGDQPPLHFPPGSQWAYSNTNYVLLAELVAKLSRHAFPDFLRAHIFDPLEMENTFLFKYSEALNVPHRVYGFYPDNQTLYDDNFLNKILGDGGDIFQPGRSVSLGSGPVYKPAPGTGSFTGGI